MSLKLYKSTVCGEIQKLISNDSCDNGISRKKSFQKNSRQNSLLRARTSLKEIAFLVYYFLRQKMLVRRLVYINPPFHSIDCAIISTFVFFLRSCITFCRAVSKKKETFIKLDFSEQCHNKLHLFFISFGDFLVFSMWWKI